MLNQVLEVTLAAMIALLAMSVAAILRVDTAPGTTTEAAADGDQAMSAAGLTAAPPPAPMWPGPLGSAFVAASAPPPRRTSWLGRTRYEARHVRGRIPKPRTPGPAGPPWGPAAPPPGLTQQGSERWV